MAQRTVVLLTDDIDGSDATETIPFAFDGVSYEIDLHDEHAEELRAAFTTWAEHARRIAGRRKVAAATTGTTTPTKKATKVNGKHSPREMRDWARSNGFEDIPDRGRVPQIVVDAFEAAH